jgi:peptidoglycan/LPS O-acetylase OafA/YrhL
MWHIPEIILFGKMEGSRKFVLWKTLIVGSIVAAFLIYALVENNLMKGNMSKRSMNIFLVAVLTIDLWAVWTSVKNLRNSK